MAVDGRKRVTVAVPAPMNDGDSGGAPGKKKFPWKSNGAMVCGVPHRRAAQ